MKTKNTHAQKKKFLPRGSLATRTKGEGIVRIVGGEFKRTRIEVPDFEGLRPTPERLRETLFDWLTHLKGDIAALRVCDMFAGSGALGFEALSRGAQFLLSIDLKRDLVKKEQTLATKLGCENRIELVVGDALKALEKRSDMFDVIFIDPPYSLHLELAAAKVAMRHLADEGLLYLEAASPIKEEDLTPLGLTILRESHAGKAFCVLCSKAGLQ